MSLCYRLSLQFTIMDRFHRGLLCNQGLPTCGQTSNKLHFQGSNKHPDVDNKLSSTPRTYCSLYFHNTTYQVSSLLLPGRAQNSLSQTNTEWTSWCLFQAEYWTHSSSGQTCLKSVSFTPSPLFLSPNLFLPSL